MHKLLVDLPGLLCVPPSLVCVLQPHVHKHFTTALETVTSASQLGAAIQVRHVSAPPRQRPALSAGWHSWHVSALLAAGSLARLGAAFLGGHVSVLPHQHGSPSVP